MSRQKAGEHRAVLGKAAAPVPIQAAHSQQRGGEEEGEKPQLPSRASEQPTLPMQSQFIAVLSTEWVFLTPRLLF